jgi:hypothetical protein
MASAPWVLLQPDQGLRPAWPPTLSQGKKRGGAPEVLFRSVPAPKLWNIDLGGFI